MSLIGIQCYIEVNHYYNHINSHLVFLVLIFVVKFLFYVSNIIYVENEFTIDFNGFYAWFLTTLLTVVDM